MSLPSFCRTVLLLAGLSLSGISSGHAADWPRQVTDSRGTHTLEHKPQRIVSTSVTLTGSLLAIDAPPAVPLRRTIASAMRRAFYASGAKWQKNAN